MSLNNLPAHLISDADNAALRHEGMAQQRRFHLGTSDVVARGNDHVVIARRKVEIAVCIAHKCVARNVPAITYIVALAFVVQVTATGWPAHSQTAWRAIGHRLHVLIDDARLVSKDRLSGARRT